MSQLDLASITRTSISTVSRLERGETVGTLKVLKKLASALEMDSAELLTQLERWAASEEKVIRGDSRRGPKTSRCSNCNGDGWYMKFKPLVPGVPDGPEAVNPNPRYPGRCTVCKGSGRLFRSGRPAPSDTNFPTEPLPDGWELRD